MTDLIIDHSYPGLKDAGPYYEISYGLESSRNICINLDKRLLVNNCISAGGYLVSDVPLIVTGSILVEGNIDSAGDIISYLDLVACGHIRSKGEIRSRGRLSAGGFISAIGNIYSQQSIHSGGSVTTPKSIMALTINVEHDIIAERYIHCRQHISAGRHIQAGWAIMSGLTITCKHISAEYQIYAGICLWRPMSPDDCKITCETINGTVAHGIVNLVEFDE